MGNSKFSNIQLDVYNRFTESVSAYQIKSSKTKYYLSQGQGAPEHIHPDYLHKGKKHMNHGQRIPYQSKVVKESPEKYHALMSTFKDVCQVVSDIIKKHLPDLHAQISIFCDILPLNDRPTTHPFPGCVINLQVATEGHLDSGDDTICVVIPFGDFEGGELVLSDAGLMINLQEGDVFIFPSFRLTHFNMHFTGVRGSLVMHSDKDGKRWVKDRNGWQFHMATLVS